VEESVCSELYYFIIFTFNNARRYVSR